MDIERTAPAETASTSSQNADAAPAAVQPVVGQKRSRPQESPQPAAVPRHPPPSVASAEASTASNYGNLQAKKLKENVVYQTTPVTQVLWPLQQAPSIPLTIEQQRAYVIEHRKISIAQLRTHLASAEAELKHLQKGGHYVNFRISSGPKLSVPAPAPKPRKKIKPRKKKEKDKIVKLETKGSKFDTDGTGDQVNGDIKIKAEPGTQAMPPSIPTPVPGPPPVPSAASAQQKTLLKELEELQQKKKRLTAMIREFQEKGGRRMKKSAEPPRNKVHWDYLLDEMGWMSTDFNNERKWKSRLAKKIMRAAIAYHGRQQALPEREAKLELVRRRKGAAIVARLIKKFWLNIGKLVQFKRNETLNQKKNVDLNRHLELLVDHTDSLTKMVAKDLVVGQAETELKKNKSRNTRRAREDRQAEKEMEAEEKTTDVEQKKEILELEAENKLSLEELKAKYSVKNATDAPSQSGGPDAESTNQSAMETEDHSGEKGGDQEEEDEDEDEDEEDEKKAMLDASEKAAQHQPAGFDLGTVQVKTKLPSLLRHGTLREYQHIGLDWLVTMCDNKLNGILADEMGLGKTIQTIAMLAHLACDRGIWGQHLVVVPTSVMVNWEIEFKRWLPGFKILCYHGDKKERKRKRKGWSNPNTFHVCITSYQMIIKDAGIFKRKRWHYLILDEAQNIKNFRSKRWQVLLTFRTERRLLLTGTPLQNNVTELWSLMHFLMPHVFLSQKEFQDWFSDPVKNMVEGKEAMDKSVITRLHKVLRPFILRRLKKDVAKQMPKKFEHVLYCRLAKRQRMLYEEFMANSATRNTLASKNFLGLMNVLMQLRKVCNHPDIFAGRPIISPYDQMEPLFYSVPASLSDALLDEPLQSLDFNFLGMILHRNVSMYCARRISELQMNADAFESLPELKTTDLSPTYSNGLLQIPSNSSGVFFKHCISRRAIAAEARKDRLEMHAYRNKVRCSNIVPLVDVDVIRATTVKSSIYHIHVLARDPRLFLDLSLKLRDLIKLPEQRAAEFRDIINHFICYIPKARARPIRMTSYKASSKALRRASENMQIIQSWASPRLDAFYPTFARMKVHFPDKRLIQWDCGKLQMLAQLLKKLKLGGHRALLFTQMTRMLDILEHFLNIYGYTYLRLDGATKPEQRQRLMERFNNNDKIFVFILSTRSGGVGVNLTGADTVIFYDTDWNPAMDLQAQDRCHRIGQTREVNIYRLVTRNTIEENILKKSNQKRQMNNMVIGDGEFNTDFFSKMDPRELLGIEISEEDKKDKNSFSRDQIERAMALAEDESDQLAARRLNKETKAQTREFSDNPRDNGPGPLTSSTFEHALSPVQRYALQFVEKFDPANSTKVPMAITGNLGRKEPPKNGSDGNVEKNLFYPSSSGIKGFTAHVAHVEKLGYIYDSKIFTPLQFPSGKNIHEEDSLVDMGMFSTEESIKKMLPSTRDRKNKGITKLFIRNSRRKRRMHEMDSAPLTVRVPLSMLKKFKRKVSRRANDSQQYSGQEKNENYIPRKAYHKIKKIRRMYTDGLFPPKVVSQGSLKQPLLKPDDPTSWDHIPWTQDEENLIERLFSHFGPNWELIAGTLNSHPRVEGRLRTPASCMHHHQLISMRGIRTDDELRKDSQKRKKKEIPRKKGREGKDSTKMRPKTDFVMDTPKQPCGNLYPLIDKSMKSINAQRRLSLENDESGAKTAFKSAHASHKKAITESHTRLGLPQLAIGKTLMPHQIIQLRTRCMMNQGKQSSSSKQTKSSKPQSANQRKQQQTAAAAQQRRVQQVQKHDSTASSHTSNGKTDNSRAPAAVPGTQQLNRLIPGQTVPNLAAAYQASHLQGANQIKSAVQMSQNHKPLANHMQRPVAQVAVAPNPASVQQLQLQQLLPGAVNPQLNAQLDITAKQLAQMPPQANLMGIAQTTPTAQIPNMSIPAARGMAVGPAGHTMPNAQFLKYVLHSKPALKQEVVKILQRTDWTEQQKIDRIAILFRDTSAKQGKAVSVEKKT
mmetsp:Transcript_20127/g.28065  ORF Transcript_20127/g.28065 Transcript_20127/m.28065 type:complete len:1990 (-) Transcript_20127:136-6105(-)